MIMDNVDYLKEKLSVFGGMKGNKEYRFLQEKFTEKLLALDRIDIKERNDVRKQRNEAINTINHCLRVLESKVLVKVKKITSELKNEEKHKSPEASSLSVHHGAFS